jgi:hypothetical protein
MLLEGSSDIILKCEYMTSGAHQGSQWLTFRNGFVMVLTTDCMALYRDEVSITDPLGNGLKALADLKEGDQLLAAENGLISSFSAGFVGLNDEKAILITPNDIQLFANKTDALYNRDELARLELT